LGANKRANTSLVLPTMGTMMRTGLFGAHSWAWTTPSQAQAQTHIRVWEPHFSVGFIHGRCKNPAIFGLSVVKVV
jgi:hypothetical protein